MLEEFNNGGLDAMIDEFGVLQYYAKQNPDKQFKEIPQDSPAFKRGRNAA